VLKLLWIVRNRYLESVGAGDFKNKLFYSQYAETGTGAYEQLTVLAIAQAISQYRAKHRLTDDYKVSVTIEDSSVQKNHALANNFESLA
jgi:hypothetical protein